MNTDDRWSLPDLETTMEWCRTRHGEGIRCTVATLAEYASDQSQSGLALRENLAIIRTIAFRFPDASVAIKPTALGILFDENEYLANAKILFTEAEKNEVDLEIDMEGTGYVDATIRSAREIAKEHPVTLALQAYLDRTTADADLCLRSGIRVRLVKGTYLGDIPDFDTIQARLKSLITHVAGSGENFCVGTHDPVLIDWLTRESGIPRHQLELGFLKGLGDETKIRLSSLGWDVSEYVPFGPGGDAYRMRRERYLGMLEKSGKKPVP